MAAPLSEVVKAYDVRGLVPEQLDASACTALGSAFAQVVVLPEGFRSVVVGHDMRDSSPMVVDAFVEGVRSQGLEVIRIGLCSTDELYYASGVLDCPGAMVTASHNPGTYNGLKMCRAGARPVGHDSGLGEVRDLAQSLLDRAGPHPPAESSPRPGPVRDLDVLDGYADHLLSLVDLSRGRELTVVVDAGNGMAGHTVPAVLGRPGLPVRVVPLYFELDGSFPHHQANPLDPANLVDLQRAVREVGADVGLAFDGDADRCFVVDEQGMAVTASAIVALIAEREITAEQRAGVPPEQVSIVHTSICSRVVPETIERLGARSVRSRVGHTFVKASMAEHNAVFGGEHSGHYYFRDFFGADTGLLAALHVLQAVAEQSEPVSRLVEPYAAYVASGEINLNVPDAESAMRAVRQWGAEQEGISVEELDGVILTRQGSPMWWASVRASNTEPLLRLNVEAAQEETMRWARDTIRHVATVGTVGS